MKRFLMLLLGPLCLLSGSALHAQSWQASSADSVVAVLELFTSEGCGLCPAADKYVNSLADKGIDDNNLIVLGFHIDYLNSRKGWIDQFAKAEFTARQEQLAHLNRYQQIFTPEFVVSGETVHSWREQLLDVIGFLNNYQSDVAIALQVDQNADQLTVETTVNVSGEDNRQHSVLYLAVTEDNVFSEVRGGDNAGRDFTHQNLVRGWYGPFSLDAAGESHLNETIELATEWQLEQLKVVAVVQNLSDGYVLQGLALPLSK